MNRTWNNFSLEHHGKRSLLREKEDIRVFQCEYILKIDNAYGIDTTATDIRSIKGVTIVTPLESERRLGYIFAKFRIKFHPQRDAETGVSYVKNILTPTINSREIPGCVVYRYIARSLVEL